MKHIAESVIRALLVGFVLAWTTLPAGAETILADPKPSMEQPRRVVLSLSSKDPAVVNGVLSNAINVQNYYGMDSVEIAIVAYGPGVRAVLKGDSPVPDRITSLIDYGIEIVACRNTLDSIHRPVEDLIDGVGSVRAGIPELIERQLGGWVYVKP